MTPDRMRTSRFSVTSTLQCLRRIGSTRKRCNRLNTHRSPRFFARKSELPAELADYFASFDLIISYLYDPDRIFEANLRRCGVQNLICGPAKIVENGGHAARQLARPIEELGIKVVDLAREFFLQWKIGSLPANFSERCRNRLWRFIREAAATQKNWPLENWIALFSASGEFSDLENVLRW